MTGVAVAEKLKLWRCANPCCPSRLHGLPRVILEAHLTVGSVVKRKCPRCEAVTTIVVYDGDEVEYRVRAG